MPSLQASVFGFMIIDLALLTAFVYVLFTPRDLPFAVRARLLRVVPASAAIAAPLFLFVFRLPVLWPALLVLNSTLLVWALWLFWKHPSPASRRQDPAWVRAYALKLEAELEARRRIEKELAFIASMAERDPNCVIELDDKGLLGYCNPATNLAFPDLEAKGLTHVVLSGLQDVIGLLHRDGNSVYRRPFKFGDRVYEQQITWSSETRKINLYITDVTEWKRLDQLKTDLLNTVSHEFRSPLTSLIASARLLESGVIGTLNEDQQKMIAMMGGSANRLNRMITDLLDISKMEAGKLSLKRREIDVSEIIENVVASFEPLGRELGIDVVAEISGKPILCLADSDKITQVVINLANNALKFTRAGHITLKAGHTDSEVQVSVKDSGIGIAKDQLHRVFGKFQQFGASLRGEKGTGLGLSLCKSLVELHGGKISLESVAGEGTTFTFTIPKLSARNVFDEKFAIFYEQAAAENWIFSAFVVAMEDNPGHEPFEGKATIAAALEKMVEKRVQSDRDFLIREGATIFFILSSLDKLQAKEFLDTLAKELVATCVQAGAQDRVLLRAQFTSLPDDGSVLEGLQARLAA